MKSLLTYGGAEVYLGQLEVHILPLRRSFHFSRPCNVHQHVVYGALQIIVLLLLKKLLLLLLLLL